MDLVIGTRTDEISTQMADGTSRSYFLKIKKSLSS